MFLTALVRLQGVHFADGLRRASSTRARHDGLGVQYCTWKRRRGQRAREHQRGEDRLPSAMARSVIKVHLSATIILDHQFDIRL